MRKLGVADPASGIHIPRLLMPKKYAPYALANLWKLNLPNGWRLLYTVRTVPGNITIFVLDVVNHREYERIFGY